jgi:hypothetical protein
MNRKARKVRERTLKRSDVDRYKAMSGAVFRRAGEAGEIKAVEAVQIDRGVYWVLVYVTGSKGPQLLFTTRDKPRAWLSLDRLASYLEKMWPEFDEFRVIYKLAEDRSAGG